MKDKRDYRDYLHDILRYAEMAERITMGVDFETFCSNDEKTLAAIQILEVIGEASKICPNHSRIDILRFPGVRWLRHETSSFMLTI